MLFSWSYERFCQVYNDIMVKTEDFDDTGALKKLVLLSLLTYFNVQWISSYFKLWQFYNRPSGFSSTQSPWESFNKDIKLTFPDFFKLTVHDKNKILSLIFGIYLWNQNWKKINSYKIFSLWTIGRQFISIRLLKKSKNIRGILFLKNNWLFMTNQKNLCQII